MRPLVALLLCSVVASAAEPQRFVERTPPAKFPPAHTADRAGNPTAVSRFAVPAPQAGTAGGNVNGVFGTDFVGLPRRYDRTFPGPTDRGRPLASNYSTTIPPIPDVFALRPFRNAVLGSKDAGR